MRRLLRAVMLAAAAGALALGAAVPAWGQTTPAPPTTVPPTPTLPVDPALPSVPTTSSAAPPTTTGSTSTGQATTSTTAAAPASDPGSGSGDGPPAWLVGLIVLGALAVLVVLLWALARLTAWEPRWLPSARHSIGEAGYRTSAGWAEFRDWLRFRR
ncbi:hypothetical protein [Capillimicrobium parvum]|uniref:Uncharacterized protein n=1 Tax=Capillimicrobium parvum TaxID=2884022 RepID=A0A9E6Y2Z6_9ACTN|nr:hypothetical protein [Capillimicrobium parvum]UGS38541.1 hypothetical protein DSM104329_04971 [Capillimicrobium parvum]